MDDSLLFSGDDELPVCDGCARAFDANATAKLAVRNLPPTWKEQELKSNFEAYGIITRVNVPPNAKPVGYIDYLEIGHAAIARYHMNGREVEGYKLRVEYWVDKQQSSRPRNRPISPPLYSSVESDTPPDTRSPASSLGLSPSPSMNSQGQSTLNSQDPQVNTLVPSPTPWTRSPASYYNQHNVAPASLLQRPRATSNQHQSNVSQEFRFNPNATGFAPGQNPQIPAWPASAYVYPHMQMRTPFYPHQQGHGPHATSNQFLWPQFQSNIPPFQSNNPQYGQQMHPGQPQQTMYMSTYPPGMPYNGRGH